MGVKSLLLWVRVYYDSFTFQKSPLQEFSPGHRSWNRLLPFQTSDTPRTSVCSSGVRWNRVHWSKTCVSDLSLHTHPRLRPRSLVGGGRRGGLRDWTCDDGRHFFGRKGFQIECKPLVDDTRSCSVSGALCRSGVSCEGSVYRGKMSTSLVQFLYSQEEVPRSWSQS